MPAGSSHLSSPTRFLWHYLRLRSWRFAALLGLVMGGVTCSVGAQYTMKLLVDALTSPARDMSAVMIALGLFIALIGIDSVAFRLAGWLACNTVVATGIDVRTDLFDHLTGHSMGYFANQFVGALGSRITATTGAVGALISAFTWTIIPPLTDFAGALVVLATIDWRMPIALTLFVILASLGVAWFGEKGRPLHQAYSRQAAEVAGEIVDTVSNAWAVKAFAARFRERQRLARLFDDEALRQRRSWMHLEKTRALHDLLLWILASSMLVWSIRVWTLGTVTAGDVLVTSALTFRILHGSRDLALSLVGATQHFDYIAESLRIIGRPHTVADLPGAHAVIPHGGAIRFEDVTYGYDEARPVLANFELTIPAGQWIGIVGPSGAGKSTLVSLVQRLDDVQDGRILIDDQCVADLAQDALRGAIGVVPQDISLFHRSILENIRYGRPEATDEDVFLAARAARCEDFIAVLPQGYDTVVGERGTMLSGGQRQRVGIARAFLKNAPIIILDEATSALDRESEAEIQDAVANLMLGRTVLAVAHRLSTLSSFDRIVVLVDGKIAEDGSPADLLRRDGLFARMWQLQADGLSWDDA